MLLLNYKTHMDKTHIILDYNSALRTAGTNNKPSIHYPRNVAFEKQQVKQYFMRIENVRLPTSFYQVNSNYNTLIIRERNSGDITQNEITITIPEANYTITELATELATQLNANTAQGNTYSVAYDDKTGKLTISYTGGASVNVDILDYVAGSTINPIIGAGEYNGSTELTGIQGAGTELTYHVNLNFISYINIELNITSHNHMSDIGYRSIGVRVPVKEARGDVIDYENHDGCKTRIRVNHISELVANVVDPYNKAIDLNGVPYSFQIVVYENE